MSSCPYQNKNQNIPFFGSENKKVDDSAGKCPYSEGKVKMDEKPVKKEEKEEKKEDVSSDEEEKQTGGCPVMNKVKKDPINKHYDQHYEIGRFGPYDFMFDLKGVLPKEEFLEQTKLIRSLPRHMKYSLFHNDEKIKKIRTKEFPLVFFVYDEVKDKGSKLFKKRKYREAIDYYTYAYSMLKWIEFKDAKKSAEFLTVPSLDPILDIDIKECKCYLDDVAVEEDSYKASIVYLLMSMASSYMELRHYSEAIECLNECIDIAGEKLPDLFFRRSQARAYNKMSNDKELLLAKGDIEKAISLKKEAIYLEHQDKLLKIIEEKKNRKLELTEKLISKAKQSNARMKEKNFSIKECIFANYDDQKTQYKVLNEMEEKYRLAIKFFTETKNEEQLNIAYKEIDNFMQTFENFLFYFAFDPKNINQDIYAHLSEENKNALNDENVLLFIKDYQNRTAGDIFGDGNYNFALYKYALEKVCEEERKEREEEQRRIEESQPKVSLLQRFKNSNMYLFVSVGVALFTLSLFVANYYFYSGGSPQVLNK